MTKKSDNDDDKAKKPSKKAKEASVIERLSAAGFPAAQIEALRAVFKES